MKARYSPAVFIFVLMALITAPVAAHHGTASFDTSKDVTLKGTVTDWIWANPHCFLKFDAMDDTGTVRNWAVEVSNPTDMGYLYQRRLPEQLGNSDHRELCRQQRRDRVVARAQPFGLRGGRCDVHCEPYDRTDSAVIAVRAAATAG